MDASVKLIMVYFMKPTENYEQLLERFTKRTTELKLKMVELEDAHAQYERHKSDLDRLVGSIQVIEYLLHGKLPMDGNHGGMKDHKPRD